MVTHTLQERYEDSTIAKHPPPWPTIDHGNQIMALARRNGKYGFYCLVLQILWALNALTPFTPYQAIPNVYGRPSQVSDGKHMTQSQDRGPYLLAWRIAGWTNKPYAQVDRAFSVNISISRSYNDAFIVNSDSFVFAFDLSTMR